MKLHLSRLPILMIFGILSCIIAGCSNDSDCLVPPSANNPDGYTPALQYGLDMADELFQAIEENTRSTKRTVETTEVFTSRTTRSSVDTLMCLVNYTDNQGFALMDIREGLEDIYAISPAGHFDMSDTIANPILNDFIQGITQYAIDKASNSTRTADSPGIVTPIGWTKKMYYVTEYCGPRIIDEWVTSWNQSYNDNLPFNYLKTGSGPVALGMLLAQFRFPTESYGFTFDWNKMLGYRDRSEVCNLLAVLGMKTPFLRCRYYPTYTSTDPAMIGDVLFNMDYNRPKFNRVFWNLKEKEFKKMIKSGMEGMIFQPLIAYSSEKNGTTFSSKNPHFWIIDGYLDRKYKTKTIDDPLYDKDAPTLLHCVWGLENCANGYYAIVGNREISPYNQDEYEYSYKDPNKMIPYTFGNMAIIGGIKPRMAPDFQ